MLRVETEFLPLFEEKLAAVLDGARTRSALDEPMRYACMGGGKRVRPVCVALGALAAGGDPLSERTTELAVAIELVHSYSLVHDDLPAMDNDDMRRGKPTVHKAFGEATAILAGDALLTLAARVCTEGAATHGAAFAAAGREIMRGAYDMAAGQAFDLAGMRTKEEFLAMYSLKTGALIRSAVRAGAVLWGADGETLAAAEEYASALGLAFQLADDLLDIGEQGSIVSAIGEAETRRMLEECTKRAVAAAETLTASGPLSDYALALAARRK